MRVCMCVFGGVKVRRGLKGSGRSNDAIEFSSGPSGTGALPLHTVCGRGVSRPSGAEVRVCVHLDHASFCLWCLLFSFCMTSADFEIKFLMVM